MPITDANVSGQPAPFPCPLCGEPLPAGADECTRCDWVQGYQHREPVTTGSPRDIIAAALSIVPGAGHIFKGHITLGIVYLAGTVLALFFIGAVGMVAMGFQLLLLPFYWLWVMLHAFLVTDLKTPLDNIPARIG